jgi:hypothetical protein
MVAMGYEGHPQELLREDFLSVRTQTGQCPQNTEEVFSRIYKMNVTKLCDSFPVNGCYCLMVRNDRHFEFFW